MNWLENNWIELFGALTGLLYIYLEIKENIWLWFVGILSCSVYIYVFFVSKFYADMALQVYYVVISIYGWYNWKKGSVKTSEELKISKIPILKIIVVAVLGIIIWMAIGFVLDKLTDSPFPYWDSLTTTLGIVGTWMLTQKYIEQWFVWIVCDIICVGLYFYKDLYPTAILYFIFAVLAVLGYFRWLKTMNGYKIVDNKANFSLSNKID